MWIENNFIDIEKDKMNVYISLNERKKFIYFKENFTNKEYKQLEKEPEFIELTNKLKFNIIPIGPIEYDDIEVIVLNVEKIENNFEKMFAEGKETLNVYSEEMIDFLKDIKNNKVFEYNATLKEFIGTKYLENFLSIKDLKKEINKEINKILKEIDNTL